MLHLKDAPTKMQIPMGFLAVFTVWIFFSINPLNAVNAWIPTGLKSNILVTLSSNQITIKNGR